LIGGKTADIYDLSKEMSRDIYDGQVDNLMLKLIEKYDILDSVGEEEMRFTGKYIIEVYAACNKKDIEGIMSLRELIYFEEYKKALLIANKKKLDSIVKINLNIYNCLDTLNFNINNILYEHRDKFNEIDSIKKLKMAVASNKYTTMRLIKTSGQRANIKETTVYADTAVIYHIIDCTAIVGEYFINKIK